MNLVNLSFTEIQHFNNNLEAIKCLKKIELNNSIPLTSEKIYRLGKSFKSNPKF